jgi:hypothetical protein
MLCDIARYHLPFRTELLQGQNRILNFYNAFATGVGAGKDRRYREAFLEIDESFFICGVYHESFLCPFVKALAISLSYPRVSLYHILLGNCQISSSGFSIIL